MQGLSCKGCGREIYISSTGYCMSCEDKIDFKSKSDAANNIVLTTSIDVPNRTTKEVISIVAFEAAIAMNILKDIANNWRDFFGGRSATSQNALKETREACLAGLREEAFAVGADAVIAVDFTYNQIGTINGGGILFVAATGTAVKLDPPPKGDS